MIPCTLSQYYTGVRSYDKIVEKDEMITGKKEKLKQGSCDRSFNNREGRF